MNLTINSKELLKAVQTVGVCIKPKNTMPILGYVLFEISNTKLRVIADNLEIRSEIELDIEFDGVVHICLPYKLLTDILKIIPNELINITFTNLKASIKSYSGLYNIPLAKAYDFPKPVKLNKTQSIKLNGLEFTEALRKAVLFSDRESIDNLHNILIKIGKEDVKIASTDKNVVYEYSLDVQGEENQILLPRDVAKYLIQTLTKDEIEINYTETHLLIQSEGRLIMAIQSQGSFLNYDPIFTSLNPNKVLKIDKDVISSAIKRLYAITDQNNYMLVFNLKSNQLELSFNNKKFNYNAKETFKCEYEGEDITIGFNANYLMNMVSAMDELIKMEFLQNNKPCLFFAENTRAIVAPMEV